MEPIVLPRVALDSGDGTRDIVFGHSVGIAFADSILTVDAVNNCMSILPSIRMVRANTLLWEKAIDYPRQAG